MPRISKKTQQERRKNLIAVAQREFLTKGFGKTTVKDITDQLNLATGTFYYHFKSKDEILVAVTEGLLETEKQKMQELCEAKNIDVGSRIKTALNIIYETFSSNKKIWEQVCRDLTLHNQFYTTGMNMIAPFIECLLEDGNQTGTFSFAHPREMAEIIISLLDFYITQYSLTSDEARKQGLFESMEHAIELILCACRRPVFYTDSLAQSEIAPPV